MLPSILLSYEQWSNICSLGLQFSIASLLFDACREGVPAAVWLTVRHDSSSGSGTCSLALMYGGAPLNRGNPKWMVYRCFIVENPIKMDDLGVHPHFRKPPYVHWDNWLQHVWNLKTEQSEIECYTVASGLHYLAMTTKQDKRAKWLNNRRYKYQNGQRLKTYTSFNLYSGVARTSESY